jgi:hypothetical protein
VESWELDGMRIILGRITVMAKKYVSEFVKRQRALTARIVMRVVWDSSRLGTYIKSKHGKLI